MHVVPCAICDEPILIEIQIWQETPYPAALCDACDRLIPWPILKVIHLLRYKIHVLEQASAPSSL